MPRRKRARILRILATLLLPALVASGAASLPDGAIFEVRELAAQRDFDGLTARLQAFRESGDLRTALRWFRYAHPDALAGLDAWAEARPDSALALVAQASGELDRAWRSRGTGLASTVDAEGWAGLQAHTSRARSLAESALVLDPTLVEAAVMLVEVGRLTGDRELEAQSLQRGLAVDPAHYGLWYEFMQGQTRRWGGSYQAQERVAAEAQREVGRNPDLAYLLGLPDADRGGDAAAEEAVAFYSRAIARTPTGNLYQRRGRRYYDLGRYEPALADLDRAIELTPWSFKAHYNRGFTLVGLKRFEEAATAFERAQRIRPGNTSSNEMIAWSRGEAERRRRWQAFLENPTANEALLYALGFLWLHAFDALLIALALWVAYRVLAWVRRPRDSKEEGPPPEDAVSVFSVRFEGRRATGLLLRALLWFLTLVFVNTYAHRWEGALAHPSEVIGILVGLAGALAYAHGRRLLRPFFWKVWAIGLPPFLLYYDLGPLGYTLDQWPVWTWIHVELAAVYACLFAYGFGAHEIWDGAQGRAHPSPTAPARPAGSPL